MISIIDISNYQVHIRWLDLPHWVNGMYARCAEGLIPDQTYGHHRAGARNIGLPFGPYYFAHPESHSPKDSADYFAHAIGAQTSLRPVLDYEWGGDKATEDWARQFCRYFKIARGIIPFVYTYSGFLTHFARPVGAGLWIANYSRNDGSEHPVRSVAPWKHWVLHQYTSAGKVTGIDGKCDVSHRPPGKTMYALVWKPQGV